MNLKEQCSATIWGERVQSWHCQRKAVVIRDGKPYCKIHDPEYIKAKRKEREAKWEAEGVERDKAWHRKQLITDIFRDIDTTTIEQNISKYKSALDLYEALKELLEWAELSYGDDTGIWADKYDPAIVKTKQALAKAEGNNE